MLKVVFKTYIQFFWKIKANIKLGDILRLDFALHIFIATLWCQINHMNIASFLAFGLNHISFQLNKKLFNNIFLYSEFYELHSCIQI